MRAQEQAEYESCPVCWRYVPLTSVQRIVWPHLDKADGRCPMSNQVLPVDVRRRVA